MAEPQVDVSVIVAVKNGAATLEQCLDSILTQSGCTVEVVVVDALSDDGTSDIVASYGDLIAHSVREPDEGIYDAWNKALAVVRGEWCAFLGADDYFIDVDSAASLLACAREPDDTPVFVFGGIVRTGGAEDYAVHPDPDDIGRFLRQGSMLPHQGVLHRTESLREIGGFDSKFRIVGDADALVRLLRIGPARRCGSIATVMRVGGLSSQWGSQRTRHLERWQLLRRESTLLSALRGVGTPFVLEQGGHVVELGLRRLLGPTRGARSALALRRRLGRAPRLTTELHSWRSPSGPGVAPE